MLTLLVKEINGFLSSLAGYIVIALFLIITGLFLWVFPLETNILDYGFATLESLFFMAPYVFLFLIPAITMRMLAEEKRTGTIEVLLTLPLTRLEIVLAKYLAGVFLVIVSLVPTLVYLLSVYFLGMTKGNIDMGGTWGSYLGLVFLASAFVSIGLFSSSITDNQILAFILSGFISGFTYIGFEIIYSLELFGKVDLFIQQLGMHAHYRSMSRGVIDSRDVVYFLSVNFLFILATRWSLENYKS